MICTWSRGEKIRCFSVGEDWAPSLWFSHQNHQSQSVDVGTNSVFRLLDCSLMDWWQNNHLPRHNRKTHPHHPKRVTTSNCSSSELSGYRTHAKKNECFFFFAWLYPSKSPGLSNQIGSIPWGDLHHPHQIPWVPFRKRLGGESSQEWRSFSSLVSLNLWIYVCMYVCIYILYIYICTVYIYIYMCISNYTVWFYLCKPLHLCILIHSYRIWKISWILAFFSHENSRLGEVRRRCQGPVAFLGVIPWGYMTI